MMEHKGDTFNNMKTYEEIEAITISLPIEPYNCIHYDPPYILRIVQNDKGKDEYALGAYSGERTLWNENL